MAIPSGVLTLFGVAKILKFVDKTWDKINLVEVLAKLPVIPITKGWSLPILIFAKTKTSSLIGHKRIEKAKVIKPTVIGKKRKIITKTKAKAKSKRR